MNISQTSGGFQEPTFPPIGPEANGPGGFPSSSSPSQSGNSSALNYDSQVNQSPVGPMNPALQGMQMAQNGSPLQDQNLSGGLMGSIEDMLQQFLAKLMNLLRMQTGENDGQSGALPATATSSAINTAPPVSGSSSPSPVSASNVRLSTPSVDSGDTSLNTSDPDLQKLVNKFGPEYQEASKETGVPAKLLVAQTMQESGGNVNATSTNPGNGKTDSGMNQINPDTYAAMRKEHPDKLGADQNDPKNQIMCSALMLKEGKEKFGSYDAALRAYNSGDDQVDKNNLSNVTIGDPNYVNEVNAYAAKFN